MFESGAIWDYSIIVAYMVFVVGIGFYFNNKKETTENYLLGGRNMPWLAIGLSCIMSLLSSISIVVVPGEIYNNGFTLYALNPILVTWLAIPFYLLFTRFYFKLGSFTPTNISNTVTIAASARLSPSAPFTAGSSTSEWCCTPQRRSLKAPTDGKHGLRFCWSA